MLVLSTPMDEEELSTKEFLVVLMVVIVWGAIMGAGPPLGFGYVTAWAPLVCVLVLAIWRKRRNKKRE